MKLPELPRKKKPKLVYRSDEYLNLVWWNGSVVEYYLWDEVSPTFTHVLTFPRVLP